MIPKVLAVHVPISVGERTQTYFLTYKLNPGELIDPSDLTESADENINQHGLNKERSTGYGLGLQLDLGSSWPVAFYAGFRYNHFSHSTYHDIENASVLNNNLSSG